MRLRKFRKADLNEVAELARKTFQKFNSKDYFNKSGVQETLDAYDIKKNPDLLKKFRATPIFYVVEEQGKIIGMVRGRKERITALFVDGRFHKKGIAKKLMDKFESEAKKQGSKDIKIRASLYAMPFYQKIGYKKTTGIRNTNGLKVYHMRKALI